jgi:hypothetical protein
LDPPVLNPKKNEKKLDRSTKTKNLKRKLSMFWTPRSSQTRETTTKTNRSYHQLTGVLSTAVENVIKIYYIIKIQAKCPLLHFLKKQKLVHYK